MDSNDSPTHIAPGTGLTLTLVGGVYTILLDGDATAGAYAVFEAREQPAGGPPPHLHERDTESFYVLEGRFAFSVADRSITLEAGAFVSVPPGVVHTYRNVGPTTARMLVIVSPAGLDEFFLAVGHKLAGPLDPPAPVTDDDLARVVAMAPKFGIRFAEPSNTSPRAS
jgi:mannose-6-phosphate isomerase-like protein (cupin superfamily)